VSANLDLVRSIYAAWGGGDFSTADWADPDIEFAIVEGPAPGSWNGVAAMANAWRDFLGAWEDFRAEPEEYRELDDERVLVLTHQSGRGKASGLEIGPTQTKVASLFQIRGGKVVKLVRYWNRDRALADLGLTSEHP
jgi:ketosteroid isomerase-like protein